MGERLTGLGPPLAFQEKIETGMDSLGVTLITPPRSRAPTWSPERALMRSVRACARATLVAKCRTPQILFSKKSAKISPQLIPTASALKSAQR